TVTSATYDNMNRLVSQQPGGAMLFRGSVNEPATITLAGKPATVNATKQFSGTTAVGPGTQTVQVTATDPSNNTRTNMYQLSETGATTALTYDPNGNLTSDGVKTYEWDAENRLTAINQGTHRSKFTYNGRSERVRVVEKDTGTVTSDKRLVWDGTILEER